MSIFSTCLPILAESDCTLEAYGRSGKCVTRLRGREFVRAIASFRGEYRRWTGVPKRQIALIFRSEETIEMLVAAIAAIAEGYTVVPFYPNWSSETQKLYLERYGLRSLIVGESDRDKIEEWADLLDHRVVLGRERLQVESQGFSDSSETAENSDRSGDSDVFVRRTFPDQIPADRACAWIFTSGTSGDLAKCTEVTFENLEIAMESIRGLDFLSEGMEVHSPLSASHIFSFVVTLAFLNLRPRRMIFSDVQYMARLPQDVIGKIDGLILVPIVLHRIRGGFYQKLTARTIDSNAPPELRRLHRWPRSLRLVLKKMVQLAETSIISREQGRISGKLLSPAAFLTRRVFGKMLRRRLGSPEFVVIGGAKPSVRAMALLEVMGIRCLQGWGMTETTGPLAVCELRDRFRGALGSCGNFFSHVEASIEEGELVVGGPQIARGYVEPDGTILPFHGRKKTGDSATFDRKGRLEVLGKTSDRITTDNGINYNPLPMEEAIRNLDLGKMSCIEEVVVVGDGRPRLAALLIRREGVAHSSELDVYCKRLIHEHNASRPMDEKIGPWSLHETTLTASGFLGPSGKIVRTRVEERCERLYAKSVI